MKNKSIRLYGALMRQTMRYDRHLKQSSFT